MNNKTSSLFDDLDDSVYYEDSSNDYDVLTIFDKLNEQTSVESDTIFHSSTYRKQSTKLEIRLELDYYNNRRSMAEIRIFSNSENKWNHLAKLHQSNIIVAHERCYPDLEAHGNKDILGNVKKLLKLAKDIID